MPPQPRPIKLDQASTGKVMRIGIVSETYPPEINGVALTLSHLVKGLRARGHTVSVVRPRQRMADSATCPPMRK